MNEIETATAPHPDPGRWIRAALVIFPVGTIVLGIASFGIWQWKKDQAADRSFKYAMALHQDITPTAIEKHANIVRTVLGQSDAMLAIPGYLESTMGPENMGYNVRRDRFIVNGAELANLDAELSGKQMPREIVLVLVPYSTDAATREQIAQSIAVMLTTAHDITGQPTLRTLRFAAVATTDGAFEKMAAQMKSDSERLMHLFILGKPAPAMQSRIQTAFGTQAAGTRIETPGITGTVPDAQQLKSKLLQAAGQP